MIQCDNGGAMAAIGSVPSAWAMAGSQALCTCFGVCSLSGYATGSM